MVREETMIRLLRAAVLLAIVAAGAARDAGAMTLQKLPMKDLINDSGAIIKATVTKVNQKASTKTARTDVTFTSTKTFMGDVPRGTEMTLSLPVGYLPDSKFVHIPGLPIPEEGREYLMFLSGSPWAFSPFTNVSHGIFEVRRIGGKNVYVDLEGHCVTGVNDTGVLTGPVVVNPDVPDTEVGGAPSRRSTPLSNLAKPRTRIDPKQIKLVSTCLTTWQFEGALMQPISKHQEVTKPVYTISVQLQR
jgi:hypothetical protein